MVVSLRVRCSLLRDRPAGSPRAMVVSAAETLTGQRPAALRPSQSYHRTTTRKCKDIRTPDASVCR